jgi:hypothetical protein
MSPISKLRAADDQRPSTTTSPTSLWSRRRSSPTLKIEKAAVEGERRTIETDLGLVKYLATLIGVEDEAVLRWFILVVALLLGPAAVLLLLAATRAGPL